MFEQKSQHTTNQRKKYGKGIFITLFGYKYIFLPRTKDIDNNIETCCFQKIQEVINKLGSERNGSKINTVRWWTASLLEICSASAKSTVASDALNGGVDCLFNNEPARKAFLKFHKHDGLNEKKNSVSFIINLDIVMNDCLISIESTFLAVSSYVYVKTVQLKEGVGPNL